MRWFGRKKGPRPGAGMGPGDQLEHELLNPDHHRASAPDGDAMMIAPAKVRSNLTLAIERVDLDIDTAISIDEDVITLDELAAMVHVGLGGVLIADVANTAIRVMLSRYPENLVRLPLPPQYDVRKLYPVSYSDAEHARAVAIFNRRAGLHRDLDPSDDLLDGLDEPGQVQVFTAVFFISMSKVGALKARTGIA